jgi:hypothetical protein
MNTATVAHQAGGENYLLCYDRANPRPAYRQLVRWAVDPDLAFGWMDALFMARCVRLRAVLDGQIDTEVHTDVSSQQEARTGGRDRRA